MHLHKIPYSKKFLKVINFEIFIHDSFHRLKSKIMDASQARELYGT